MLWFLTMISGWSFRQICKNYESFQAIGIIVNKNFMKSYFIFVLSSAVSCTIVISLNWYQTFCSDFLDRCSQDKRYRTLTAKDTFNSIMMLFLFAWHVMMFVIYMKYSRFKKKNKVEQDILMQKLWSYYDNSEQARAERRYQAYRQMADKQIWQILESVMSLSDSGKSNFDEILINSNL